MSEEPKEPTPSASPVEDPMGHLLSTAIQLNEMFNALQKAGFTNREALYIVGQTAAAGIMEPVYSISLEDDYDDEDGFDEDDDTFM